MRVVNSLVEHCFAVIELLAMDDRAMRLGDIAERLDLQKSGVHRLLTTLCRIGWTEQVPETGFYRLTLKLAILGQHFLVATNIPDICQPVLNRLAGDTREFVRMAIVDGGGLTWVSYAQGAKAGLIYQPDVVAKVPLHVTANGKAWLATLPMEEAVGIVLKDGFGDPDEFGPNVVRTVDGLMRGIEATKERGWGFVKEEADAGVAAIAAAIHPPSRGAAVGTVSVAGPIVRVTDHRIPELAEQVKAAATELGELWPLRTVQGFVPGTSKMPSVGRS